MKNTRRQTDGLSLIEILVVISLTSILAIAFLGLQYLLAENRELAIGSYYNIEESNSNMNHIVRELRTARLGENGAYTLISAHDNELIFYSDYDFDGVSERIRYTLIDNTLEKGVTEPLGQPAVYDVSTEKVKSVATKISNSDEPMFTYYNGDWPADTTSNPLSTPANLSQVKLVRIKIRVDSSDDTKSDFELESYTQIRMLKNNLGE